MSKQLYINNKRLIIDEENTYFPFSHTISDLENVNIIGIPQSKTVIIPRCIENDEIFGYLGELSRQVYNYNDNEKIGVSFNQTKKGYYKLTNGSEVVSEGQIQVTNVNEENYEIILYDSIIDLIEQFEGNTEQNTGFLNNLNIVLYGNTYFSGYTNAQLVKDLTLANGEVKPVVNIKEFESKGTNIRCWNIYSGQTYLDNVTLDEDVTPIQMRSVKNYEIEYAVPLSTVVRSINDTYNNTIAIDSRLNSLFNDIHINCGSPKNIISREEFNLDSTNFEGDNNGRFYPNNPSTLNEIIRYSNITSNSIDIINKNGNYYFEIPLKFEVIPYYSYQLTDKLTNWNNTIFTTSTPSKTKIGDLYANLYLCKKNSNGDVVRKSLVSNSRIEMIKDVNVTYNTNINGLVTNMYINSIILLDLNFYPNFESDIYNSFFEFDFTRLNTEVTFLNNISTWVTPSIQSGGRIVIKNVNIRTGDYISGNQIFPKLPIKDFIIGVAKTFNIDLVNVNGVLTFKPKYYNLTDEILVIDNITDIDTNLFNFNRLILNTNVSSNSLISDYQKYEKEVYGQQNINTGYSIKNSTKVITIPASIPSLIVDYNKFAYDRFTNYFNAGRSRGKYGVTEGFDDDLVFCYINKIENDKIYITDDTYFEGGMVSNHEINIPEGENFTINNEWLKYTLPTNPNNYGVFSFKDGYPLTKPVRLLDYFYISSPYNFDENSKILQSLEMNKPRYNYANITDDQYPESSTLYETYHRKMLTDKYNVNTNVITANIFMDKKPNIYNIYNVKNVNYIISDLQEYDPSIDGDIVEGVRLMKVNYVENYINPYELSDNITMELTSDGYILPTPAHLNCNGIITKNNTNKIIDTIGIVYSTSNINPIVGGTNCNNEDKTYITNNYSIIQSVSYDAYYYVKSYIKYTDNTYIYSSMQSIKTPKQITNPTFGLDIYQVYNGDPYYSDVRFVFKDIYDGGSPLVSYAAYVSTTIPDPDETNGYDDKITGTTFDEFTFTAITQDIDLYYQVFIYSELSEGFVSYLFYVAGTVDPILSFITPTIGQPYPANGAFYGSFSLEKGTGTISSAGWYMCTGTTEPNGINHQYTGTVTTSDGTKSFTKTGLPTSSYFKIRAYANDTLSGLILGPVNSIQTAILAPSFEISCSILGNTHTATALVNYTIDNVSRISRRGIVYSRTVSNPTVGNGIVLYDTTQSNGTKNWDFNITTAFTSSYRVRAYIKTTDGTYYYSPSSVITNISQ